MNPNLVDQLQQAQQLALTASEQHMNGMFLKITIAYSIPAFILGFCLIIAAQIVSRNR